MAFSFLRDHVPVLATSYQMQNNKSMEYLFQDSGNKKKLEKFGPYTLIRPEIKAIWESSLPKTEWQKADAEFIGKGGSERGEWKKKSDLPDSWIMEYESLELTIKFTPSKHLGVFPEQGFQLEWIKEKIKNSKRPIKLLNLFGYTGVTSLIAAKSGAEVTHVDSSKPALTWGKENQKNSHLENEKIRWIHDDAQKFVEREIKRRHFYDAVIMDPPAFGRGRNGEIWNFEKDIERLLKKTATLLSQDSLFLVLNMYTESKKIRSLVYVLESSLKTKNGRLETKLLDLKRKGNILHAGTAIIWTIKNRKALGRAAGN